MYAIFQKYAKAEKKDLNFYEKGKRFISRLRMLSTDRFKTFLLQCKSILEF